MKLHNLLFGLAICGLLGSCGHSGHDHEDGHDHAEHGEEGGDHEDGHDHGDGHDHDHGDALAVLNEAGGYGEVIDPEGAMSGEELVAMMAEMEEHTCKVKATVTENCIKKGCWMNLDMGGDERVRVTFKDYGFFVPLDFAGTNVVVEGTAYWDTIGVDMLRHFAEDEGLTQEEIDAITEPEFELGFEAIGVMPIAAN